MSAEDRGRCGSAVDPEAADLGLCESAVKMDVRLRCGSSVDVPVRGRETNVEAAAREESSTEGVTREESTVDGPARVESSTDGSALVESSTEGTARVESGIEGSTRADCSADGRARYESGFDEPDARWSEEAETEEGGRSEDVDWARFGSAGRRFDEVDFDSFVVGSG